VADRGEVVQVSAHQQQAAATRREAVGQCQMCGAFRLDGGPPTVHRTGCPAGDPLDQEIDGSATPRGTHA
jgi:hypothetical protein